MPVYAMLKLILFQPTKYILLFATKNLEYLVANHPNRANRTAVWPRLGRRLGMTRRQLS